MKRVKAACILQTLIFMQKEEANFTKDEALKLNNDELSRYLNSLEESGSKYSVDLKEISDNGSIILHIRKQYTSSTPVGEYFE